MKHVVITGASSGIGRAIAVEFAKPGTFLLLTGRNKKELIETKKQVELHGAKVFLVLVDLSKKKEIQILIETIKMQLSTVEVFIHVAGIWHGENEVYAGVNYQAQQVVMNTYMVGLIAPALLVHGLLPLMKEGSTILMISGTFVEGARGWLPYYVSKRALEDLTVGLSQELQEKGIQVNGISPADTATDAYKKYFPQHISQAIDPKEVAVQALDVYLHKANYQQGTIFILEKGKAPFEGFHY